MTGAVLLTRPPMTLGQDEGQLYSRFVRFFPHAGPTTGQSCLSLPPGSPPVSWWRAANDRPVADFYTRPFSTNRTPGSPAFWREGSGLPSPFPFPSPTSGGPRSPGIPPAKRDCGWRRVMFGLPPEKRIHPKFTAAARQSPHRGPGAEPVAISLGGTKAGRVGSSLLCQRWSPACAPSPHRRPK
jgi:hypothetical protein